MTRTTRSIAFAVLSLAIVLNLRASYVMASGPIGIYGIVEKVVFEPNEHAPERIQVWGAFAYLDSGPNGAVSAPKRGYLYFGLPANRPLADIVKKEWADLKAVAGTGQAVGFGNGFSTTGLRVRPSSEAPTVPSNYSLNTGIVKLSETGTNAAIVKSLKDTLARK
jgi:hypothetical protein